MRNVTILRSKTGIACLATMKVYIEDPLSEEIKIGGVPCRKLGELKNGEERNFVVGDEEAKIYVIADTLSKNMSNEFYQLPAGTEDIVLSGKCVYNPAAGNPFRFDNNSNEAVKKNRKKNTVKGVVILVVALLVGVAIGLLRNLDFASAKTFSGDGMSITLTDNFYEDSAIGFTQCYSSNDAVVMIMKEKFSAYEGLEEFTLEEYAEALIGNMNTEIVESDFEIKTEGDLVYFEYVVEDPSDDSVYKYFAFVYKSDDAFWFVDFAVMEEDASKMKDDVFEWASSVKFD
ncbi:MAG: hypothetical protein E7651_06185 [Ruminococcaceae bacterium]|nr:hypothetical protein [Oscillospiraceae bacterium]